MESVTQTQGLFYLYMHQRLFIPTSLLACPGYSPISSVSRVEDVTITMVWGQDTTLNVDQTIPYMKYTIITYKT